MFNKIEGYRDICQRQLSSANCCRPWSLSGYVTLLANKDNCFEITVILIISDFF